jgi:hypothetical protein
MINWIFCDEKLPSANEWVIILVAELDYGQAPSDSNADWSLDTDEGCFDGKNWHTVNDWDEGQPWKVIAWSPKSLPSLDVVKEHWRKT